MNEDIKVFKIQVKFKDMIDEMLMDKQHLYNNLVIIYNNTRNQFIRNYITSPINLRRLFSSSENKEDDNKFLRYLRMYYKSSLDVFIYFYGKYSNKIFVDVIKSFKTSVNNNLSRGGSFRLKTRKLSKIKKYSIECNSNIVRIKGNKLIVAYLNKKYKEEKSKENFSYYLSPDIIERIKYIKNVIFVKIHNKYFIHITYASHETYKLANGDYILSIDPGVNNHFTLTSNNPDCPSIIIKNRAINRINRTKFNISSKLQSRKDILFNERNFGEEYDKLNQLLDSYEAKRLIIINNEFNKITNRIIDLCIKYNITKIIYGYNIGQSNRINIGRNNNKRFYSIPHYEFKEMLKYKALLHNIELILQEESYTSKLSCIQNIGMHKYSYSDNRHPTESIKKLGLRGYRGHSNIYKDKTTGYEFHSDVNGSFNIMFKYLKKYYEMTYRQLFNPIRINDDFQFLKLLNDTEKYYSH